MTVVGVVSVRLSNSSTLPPFWAMKMRPSGAKRIAVGNDRLLQTIESWKPVGSVAAAAVAPAVADAPGVSTPGWPGGFAAGAAAASRTTRAPTSAPDTAPHRANRSKTSPPLFVLRCSPGSAGVQAVCGGLNVSRTRLRAGAGLRIDVDRAPPGELPVAVGRDDRVGEPEVA